jgi:hypothetical protein
MANNGQGDPRHTVIVVGETGIYKLTRDQWEKPEFLVNDDAGEAGVISQLTQFGAYLSFIPDEIAVGFGFNCTVVNVKTMLKNNP